jgi:putative ABC transport system permease protein
MARTSFTLVLLGIAAVIALVLGAVGLYGVISYAVAQRTREFGVRMALGARRADVGRLVLRHAAVLVAVGVAAGLIAAFGLTRLMSAMLFGVAPADPITFGSVAVVLGAVALVASLVPVMRATRVDPLEALRWE